MSNGDLNLGTFFLIKEKISLLQVFLAWPSENLGRGEVEADSESGLLHYQHWAESTTSNENIFLHPSDV